MTESMAKRKISITIPTYNEEQNIAQIVIELKNMFHNELSKYDYEIVIIDNDSTDQTRSIIRDLCKEDRSVKAIFNEKNFGWLKSPFYGLLQTTGDCTILLCADFQDSLELIPVFVEHWEKGSKCVVGQKNSSEENPIMYAIRSLYYKIIKGFSEDDYIMHFTGFGLYDSSFLQILRELKDPSPFLRGYVTEFIGHPKIVRYKQPKRKRGKSWSNFSRLYDTAMVGITAYTKVGLRFATFLGVITAFISFGIGLFYLIYKATHWYTFSAGMAPLIVGVFFAIGIQLFFMGMMGEYVLSINERVKNRPLVIEKERINFDEEEKEQVEAGRD